MYCQKKGEKKTKNSKKIKDMARKVRRVIFNQRHILFEALYRKNKMNAGVIKINDQAAILCMTVTSGFMNCDWGNSPTNSKHSAVTAA